MNQENPVSAKNIDNRFVGRELEGVREDRQTAKKISEKEEDEESLLSSLEHQDSDLNKLDISDYCISSDAETEKMNDDRIEEGLDATRPHISDLINDQDGSDIDEKKRKDEDRLTEDNKESKRIKLEVPVSDVAQIGDGNEDDENEVADEEVYEEEAVDDFKKEVPTQSTELKQPSEKPNGEDAAGVIEEEAKEEAEEEVDEEVEEEVDEEVEEEVEPEEEPEEPEEPEEEDSNNKASLVSRGEHVARGESDNEESKPMSPMPSPIEIEQQRLSALKEITEIEYKFVELRQKLFDNKLLRLQAELQMCREGSHPELQTYYQKIASIRDYKLRRAYQRQKYELRCIDKETRATRIFIHQDFLRQVSDTRNQLLNETTQKWYDINKERRDMDICVPEVNYHVPIKIAGKTLSCITGYAGPAQQRYSGEPLAEDLECENIQFRYRSNAVDKLEVIVDRMRLNNELSDLEGLKKYYNGFPGAPELGGLRDSEVFDDIQRLPVQR